MTFGFEFCFFLFYMCFLSDLDQFTFNKTPLARDMDEAFRVACFEQCPSRGALREKDQPAVARCHQIDIDEDSST